LKTEKGRGFCTDLFFDLVGPSSKGLFISRRNPSALEPKVRDSPYARVSLLSRRRFEGFDRISDIDGLVGTIDQFTSSSKQAVVMIDGLPFLASMFEFNEVLRALFEIDEIISQNGSILLLHLDPDTVSGYQKALIENELLPSPRSSNESTILNDELASLLVYVREENDNGTLVYFKKISRRLKISHVEGSRYWGRKGLYT
jgi:hypothetical protein